MLSGRRLDLLDPAPLDIEIEDIAHGLSFVARWNGQTKGEYPYSVAEHSVFVEKLYSEMTPDAPAKWRLAALLHDAPEYVIGDMISPVKVAVGPGYKEMDDRLTAAVHLRFGLPASIPVAVKKQIKRADNYSAWFEAISIAGFSSEEAAKLFKEPRFELKRRVDDLVYVFERQDDGRYKRTDGDHWIIKDPSLGWIAWDYQSKTVMGRPWSVMPMDQNDTPPKGEWVSKKGDKSYVYDLVHSEK